MATILPFPKTQSAFGPKEIQAMSMALDDVCNRLEIGDDKTAKEVIAIRIFELARRGEWSPTKLRDHVLDETKLGLGSLEDTK